MIQTTTLDTSRAIYERLKWSHDNDNRFIEKVWMRSYHLSEMGPAHDDYHKTPESERKKVVVDDWRVTTNPRGMITTGQEVFKWWYSKVRELEDESVPAYTLDYLLDKLPYYYPKPGNIYHLLLLKSQGWIVGYCYQNGKNDFDWKIRIENNNSTEAAGKLVIALADAGVLKGDV